MAGSSGDDPAERDGRAAATAGAEVFFDILKLRRDLRREAQGFGVRRPASSEGHAPAALRDGDGNGWMGALVAGESGVAATALPPQSKTRWLQSPSVDRSKRDRQVVGFQRP